MDGFPIWYELMVPQPESVSPFYRALLGWEIAESGTPMANGEQYRAIVRRDGENAGGVLPLTPEMVQGGARPMWAIYFYTADVDDTVSEAKALGASALMDPVTMNGVGRMAMLGDPQGAPFYVMTPLPPEDAPGAKSGVFASTAPGHAAWNELNTDAAGEQLEFYTSLFDWKVTGEMPMPGEHIYKFFSHGETELGAVCSMKQDGAPNAWLPYFRVEDIDSACTAIKANGGTIAMGPHEVPDDDYIVVAFDPAGTALGLAGRKVT